MVFSLMLSRTRNLSLEQGLRMARALSEIPSKVSSYLAEPGPIDEAVRAIIGARYVLFLGRGFSYPVALEGALKLKEVAYVPAEGYPAGEMKHGPIALVDANCPTVFVAPSDSSYEKVISNAQEIKARRGGVVAIVTRGDESMRRVADHVIEVEPTHDLLSPLLTVIPLQLLAYRIALKRGCNVDKPRNLAKSVTVE
jgi:glucosamine--fructose-6-phosphate aminotransferase (isomerizing)